MAKKFLCFLCPLFFLQAIHIEAQYVRPVKIKMVWDYIQNQEANANPGEKIVHPSLDIISPTWFSIGGGDGEILSLADSGYVKWAHDRGLKVWPVFENSSDNSLTITALFTKNKRERIADELIKCTRYYGFDGININFEGLRDETGKYYELFIAELYEKLKPLGITLSVDVPLPLNDIHGIYDVKLIAKNCDFIVLMGYDQHHPYSPVIGSVAAIGWVKQGIEEALQYMPSEKVILGIPFYTRVWLEDYRSGRTEWTSELVGMKEAYELFENNARIWERDREMEQIYAEYDVGNSCYKAWLEDEHSISLKLDTINDYDLAGMSAWRRGWEWKETWDMIEAYFE